MRKTLLFLTIAILTFALPAFAQHGHAAPAPHSNVRAQNRPQRDDHGRGVQHNSRQAERDFHRDNGRVGYHFAEPRGEFRAHWDGRRFDHGFFDAHWGFAHPFFWGHCGWYGPRFGLGSYFWFNGVYFVVVDPIPAYWYDGQVTVIYDDACGCYYVVNPAYPGARIHVDIRF